MTSTSFRRRLQVLGLALLIAAHASFAKASQPATIPEQPIPDFTLQDFSGQAISFAEAAAGRPVVVIFFGTDCPLVKLYGPRLAKLQRDFASRNVTFLGIDSNIQDSQQDIARFARHSGIDFPLLKDPDHAVADLFNAERTPEVFLLDASRHVRYRGRIDDQYGVTKQGGYRRDTQVRDDLRLAIEEVLAKKPVTVPVTEATGCIIGRRPEPNEAADVTWSNQIARIVQQRCQECHRPGEVAPFSMLTYEDILGWGETIAEVVRDGRMPPWHASPAHGSFRNDGRLTAEEIQLIETWVENGAPRGNPADEPPPRTFLTGWQIPEPDAIFPMADKPYVLPANGAVQYQYFTVDPKFDEGKWISAVESRPSNPAVVHHINVFVLTPEAAGNYTRDDLTNHLISAYAPGLRTSPFPAGAAYYVPAGSKFIFQMHYSPIGTVQEDCSYMGVCFAEPSEVKERVEVALSVNDRFTIPPENSNYPVTSFYEYITDATLYALSPHMHLRGKAFRFTAFYPDGRQEILLDIPQYDFNWQTIYELSDPKSIPRGTIVECNAAYDNSADNLANPDPSQSVRWGDQTFEEMMIGYMFVRLPKETTLDAAPPVTAESIYVPPLWLAPLVAVGIVLGGAALWYRYRLMAATTS